MFSFIKSFLARHKKKLFVLGMFAGGAVLGTRYAQRRFIEWQEKETKEFLERTRKQHYFESSEKTCNQTIIFLSSTLRENIVNHVNCEAVIQQLREGPSNKLDLWQELKILVFTKVCLLVYSGTLLVIALRIQLNVIGGFIYSKSTAPGSDPKFTSDLQEKYLSQCHYFLEEGMKELCPLVKEKVNCVLQDITLKQNMTLQHIENMFWAIQSAVNDDPRGPLNRMPELLYGSGFEQGDTFIKGMMLDTIELLNRPEVKELASSCISRGFSHLVDRVSEFFLPDDKNPLSQVPSTTNTTNGLVKFAHPNNFSRPFAKIIPIINGYGNSNRTDGSESWVSPFLYMEGVKTFGANIFESYSYSSQ
ncbi:peroxisomal biogenesis factor 3-like [Macrosteles quadrilineatus]|uniref:peroxisomal biogenesis factor 3-like n=1 Tax=Macrosteles quadrilineatus TaxID=74068 RepID=UPI0023E0CABB|nr:peroxisomal biogenesis factor 3-like [Macrosteles quadrilineatus]